MCSKCSRWRVLPRVIVERYGAPGRVWHCDLPRKDGGLEFGCRTAFNREERPPHKKKERTLPRSDTPVKKA